MRKVMIAAAAVTTLATPAAAAPVVWAGNGHSYDYIQQGVTWDAARAAAILAGGYLVTVTSAAEQDFIYNNVTRTTVWAGGSDAAAEGTWIWVDGPEAGQVFWNGGPGGSSPTYANWNGGEPNNLGDEDYLHINWSADRWNDIPGGSTYGYIIEFGGQNGAVPEPATWALLILGFGAVGGAMRRNFKVRPVLTFS